MDTKTVSFLLTLCGCAQLSMTLSFKQLGVLKVKEPAFLGFLPNVTSGTTKYDLLISTDSGIPFTQDHVWGVPDVGSHLETVSSWKPELITNKLHWPNGINAVPDDVFGKSGVISVAGGFFIPTKTDGAVSIIVGWPGKAVSPVTISSDDDNRDWFYHQVEWIDMDGDGRKDALTARAYYNPLESKSGGELVWFQQPQSNPTTTPSWPLHQIINGPDLFFSVTDLIIGGRNRTAVISCGFFSKELVITWTEDPSGNWTDEKSINCVVIDSTLGQCFSVEVTDLNADGKKDLLVTVNSAKNGTVLAYEIPNDVVNTPFKRRVLKSGFSVSGLFTTGKGAPGAAFPFYPHANKTIKPCIIVSGDDDKHAHVMTPFSSDPDDWLYALDTIYSGDSNVGQVVAKDVNGDGLQEVFVTAYNANQVVVYEVMPDGTD